MEKVSIIIPVYNVEEYIEQCLNSVLNQTYKELEIIIIDDGSTDLSGKICDQFEKKDSRIKVIHQNNTGAANAKNRGLEEITGEYFTFLDSDDYVETDWIECLIYAIKEFNADVAECDFTKEYVGYSDEVVTTSEICLYSAKRYMQFYIENWTAAIFWNKIFKSTLTANVRFRTEKRCIDDEFYTYKLLTEMQSIVKINKNLYHYRQRYTSAVKSIENKAQITDDALEVLIERYEWIGGKYPDLKKTYINHDIGIMFYFAETFLFTKSTVKRFRKISKYYLLEVLKLQPDIRMLKNAIRLVGISEKKLYSYKELDLKKEKLEYYS